MQLTPNQTLNLDDAPVTTEPLLLEGRHVRLEPLTMSHQAGLTQAADDGQLWKSAVTIVPSKDTIAAYIEKALAAQREGRELPFAIVHKPTSAIIGSTRYMNIQTPHRRREIGSTWIAGSFQRTAVNTEAKYLLLKQAFEGFGCIRVEFLTDVLNEQSRAAIGRIGAKQEGILRSHIVMPNGRRRDSVCFSIIEVEWPQVREWLLQRLQRTEAESGAPADARLASGP